MPHCSQNCLFRIFKPGFFPNPTHHFLEPNGCVFWGGGGGLVFSSPHFPFQPIFPNPPFSRGEVPLCLWGVGYCTFIPIFPVKLLCVLGGGGLHCYTHFPELKFLCVWGGGVHFY